MNHLYVLIRFNIMMFCPLVSFFVFFFSSQECIFFRKQSFLQMSLSIIYQNFVNHAKIENPLIEKPPKKQVQLDEYVKYGKMYIAARMMYRLCVVLAWDWTFDQAFYLCQIEMKHCARTVECSLAGNFSTRIYIILHT